MASRSSSPWKPGVALALAAALAAGAVAAQPAPPPGRAHTEALAARAAERLRTLQHEAERLASQERTLLGDLRKLEVDRQIKTIELRRVTSEADDVSAELATTTARIGDLEQRERAGRPALRARLVQLYKLGQGRYLKLLLSTADLRKLGEASRSVAELARLDRERVAARQRMISDLKAARTVLEQRQARLATLQTDARRAKAAADRAAAARNALIADIDSRRDLNAQLSGELQAAQQKLQLALRGAADAGAAPAVLPLRPFRGDLAWPVDGSVRQRFGEPAAMGTPSSNGIMIAAPEGTGARAVHDGTVAFADSFAGFGNLVILDHGARSFSLYGNLLEIDVRRGQHVEAGQAVGLVGPSPLGPAELYFELRVDARPVDPLQWLKKR